MSSGGGGSTNTTTQVQQIPKFEQQYAQQNQDIAASIASQAYPTYSGQLIAGMTPQQTEGMQQAQQASTSYEPYLNAAAGYTQEATQPWDAQTAAQYMSPYAEAALQPQVEALQLQSGQQQQQINSQATQAGAFGDARQGVAQGAQNFTEDQALNNLEATGMNTAYNTGLSAYQNEQQTLGAAGQSMATLGSDASSLGIAGANANFSAGTQQQQLEQQQLTEAYNNFMNQVNWPQNELNVRMSALSNSPYNNTSYTSLAPANSTAQNVGAFTGISGALGNLLSGSGSSSSAPIGGTSISSDIRLKKNIRHIGHTSKGIPVYKFNYLWDDIDHVGVMAHEAEEIIPEAVSLDEHGFKQVRYDMVG